jgi:uncharacterized protein YijF (DUF1287 family)
MRFLACCFVILLACETAVAQQPQSSLVRRTVESAIEQTQSTLHYDPSYVKLKYPGGDVPMDRGVCSDVIIRAFRSVDVDLQVAVHEDMRRDFTAYPKLWKHSAPDRNIDHRRVANLMTFFQRQGKALPITSNAADYLPGDIVAWDLGGRVLHLGMVVNTSSSSRGRSLIVHNIGYGAKQEDVLFSWRIIGHYRYFHSGL